MSKFFRPRSRFFNPRTELTRIDQGLAAWQTVWGQTVDWWFYDESSTIVDELFDEGSNNGGRRWNGPRLIPVLSAVRTQGTRTGDTDGFYSRDELILRMSYDQARSAGLVPGSDIDANAHLKDRVVYDGFVFGLTSVIVQGQFDQSGRDVTVTVTGSQLRPDELVMDVDFQSYTDAAPAPAPSPLYDT